MMHSGTHTRQLARILLLGTAAVASCLPLVARSDDYVHMLQYQLEFGNGQPVGNVYMSMQSHRADSALHYDWNAPPPIRSTLYSTDPGKVTMLNPWPGLSLDEDAEVSVEDVAAGVATAAYGLLLIGGTIAAVANSMNDLGDIEFEIDPEEFNICGDDQCSNLISPPPETTAGPDG